MSNLRQFLGRSSGLFAPDNPELVAEFQELIGKLQSVIEAVDIRLDENLGRLSEKDLIIIDCAILRLLNPI